MNGLTGIVCKSNVSGILKTVVILFMVLPGGYLMAQRIAAGGVDSLRSEMDGVRTTLMEKMLQDDKEACQVLEVRLLRMELALMEKMKSEAALPVSDGHACPLPKRKARDIARDHEPFLTRLLRRLHILPPLPRVVTAGD